MQSSPSNDDTGGSKEPSLASRGALKLQAALDAFALSPAGFVCADFGCSTGGFTDCLLRAGAARVYSIDTAYGQLAWRLRNDPRVVVMERTNALHATPPEAVDLVVADMGWTPQRLLVPAAVSWLKPEGRIITLVKPHYEVPKSDLPRGGVLDPADAERITRGVIDTLPSFGVRVLGWVQSPILGGATKAGKGRGNPEWLALLARA